MVNATIDPAAIERAFQPHLANPPLDAPTDLVQPMVEDPSRANGSLTAAHEVMAAGSPSRLDYSQVGICIYCGKPMRTISAAGEDSYVCMNDRYVAPLPNE